MGTRLAGVKISRALAALCLTVGAVWVVRAAELPPEIQADRYLVQAERQIQAGQPVAAVATLDRILALQAAHGLEIPAAFWFKHAEASLAAGLFDQAVGSAAEYLRRAGRDGEHYLAALRILDAAELGKATEPGRTFTDELASGGTGPEMVVIPAGVFRMGCLSNDDACFDSEKPVREVTIAAPFALSVHEVTFADLDACVAAGGCEGYGSDDGDWGRGARPVIYVSWEDAQGYVAWLSGETGAEYRLPSEAEWEYAARAGATTKHSWGNELGANRANCDGCGSRWDDAGTAPVGSFAPNGFGLYDMHGNVWEWVADCWNGSYAGGPSDGGAWLSGDCDTRVGRGGAWDSNPTYLRAAYRLRGPPDYITYPVIGFRVARTLTP